MENPSTPVPTPTPIPAPDSTDLAAQVASLNKLCTWLLFSTLLIGGSFGWFFLRQVSAMNRQVTETKKFVADYRTNSLPKIQWFVGSLQLFAKTNADFNPILAKYGLLPTNAPAAAKPPATPAPKK